MHVPSNFSCGINKQQYLSMAAVNKQQIGVPLLKDMVGDVSSLKNCNAITLSNAISKVCELCLLQKMDIL